MARGGIRIANHETHEKKTKGRKGLEDDAFVFDLWVIARIHQEAEFVAGGMHVIVDLGAILRGQFVQRLDFHDHLVETDEVGFVLLIQKPIVVPQGEFGLRPEDNTVGLEF
jgi:hypothetical protein